RATDVFDSPSEAIAPSGVVVERDHDRFDAMSVEPSERRRRNACAPDRDHGRVAVSAKVMNIDQTLDEHDLSALRRLESKNLGQSIRREVGAACSAEVEVTRRGIGVVKRTSPERPDSPTLISPGAAKPARPATVGKHAGLRNLEIGVAGRHESVL